MTQHADIDAIRAIIEGVNKAHRDRDAQAIVAPFATDALLFDLAPPLAQAVGELTDGWGANVVFEASGSILAFGGVFELACPGGCVVLVGMPRAFG